MNINGILLLRELGLPGPRRERVVDDLSKIDLEWLYDGAASGATIVACDRSEPIGQNPLLEKDVHRYGILREDYPGVGAELLDEILRKGARREDVLFLTHQAYLPPDISWSGRAGLVRYGDGTGCFSIDAVPWLRKAGSDITPEFCFSCPVANDVPRQFAGRVSMARAHLPQEVVDKLVRQVSRIPGSPHADFEVYAGSGELFYHDLFLAQTTR